MSSFSVTCSTFVEASPSVVLAKVGDLREWRGWWPWNHGVVGLERTYDGPEVGVGSRLRWGGDPRAGEGRLEIVEHTPERVVADVAFTTPYRGSITTTIEVAPCEGGVEVAWSMSGDRNPVTAVIGRRVMDRDMTDHLERGLGLLKGLCETPTA